MLLHVLPSDPVRDPLEGEGCEKPIKNRRCAIKGDGLVQTGLANFSINLIEKRYGPRDGTDCLDQAFGPGKRVGRLLVGSSL